MKLLSKLSATDAMPTLLNRDAKNAKVSTDAKMGVAKRTAEGRPLSVTDMISRVSAVIEEMEDLRDELTLVEARRANRGKSATTVNDLRRKRGLPEL